MLGNRSITKTNNQTGQAFFPVNKLENVRNVHFSLWPSEIEMQIYRVCRLYIVQVGGSRIQN